MIDRFLAFLFPPKLPGRIGDWETRVDAGMVEEGSAGPAKPKQYRDGIERYFAENPSGRHAYWRQYQQQLADAEKWVEATTQELIDQGYVNTIHDCWGKRVRKSLTVGGGFGNLIAL